MTTHKSMKRVLLSAAICLMAGASFLVSSGRGSRPLQNPATQTPTTEKTVEVRDALWRGGLREAAKLKGHFVMEDDPHWDLRLSVETLTKNSAAVIVGRFTRKLDARLLVDGKQIFTDYEVAVEELVKGDIKQSETIVVTLPGGRIVFDDGTSAEIRTPTFEHPHIGRAYTLFLIHGKSVPSVFFLFGGPEGMFDIEDTAGVKSHGGPDDPGAVETKSQSRESFMKKVRELARKWPNPGKCCG